MKGHGTFVVNCKGWGEGGLLKTEQDGEPLAGTKFFFYMGAAWQSNIFAPIG